VSNTVLVSFPLCRTSSLLHQDGIPISVLTRLVTDFVDATSAVTAMPKCHPFKAVETRVTVADPVPTEMHIVASRWILIPASSHHYSSSPRKFRFIAGHI